VSLQLLRKGQDYRRSQGVKQSVRRPLPKPEGSELGGAGTWVQRPPMSKGVGSRLAGLV
jgi:hypothetical protein